MRLRAGGGVGGGGTGGDHVERVAEDVRENHLEDARRGAGGGEASALDAGEPLADRVDLHDVGATGKELARDVGEFNPGDERRLEKRRTAAGEEEHDRVVRGQTLHEVEDRLRRAERVFVRHGVPRLVADDVRKGMFHVAVLRHDDAAREAVSQDVARGGGHAPGGLAGGDKQDLASWVEGGRGKGAAHGGVGLHGVDRLPGDLNGCLAEFHFHIRLTDKIHGDGGERGDESDGGLEGDEAQARADVHEHRAAGRVEE